jgi:hypothetical protein
MAKFLAKMEINVLFGAKTVYHMMTPTKSSPMLTLTTAKPISFGKETRMDLLEMKNYHIFAPLQKTNALLSWKPRIKTMRISMNSLIFHYQSLPMRNFIPSKRN